ARNRASIILYFFFTQGAALVIFGSTGMMTWKTFWIALPMIPTIALGTWIGEWMFGKASDALYRKVALAFLLAIGISTFFA
ncbi:MAG: TSUP family transporter, partial [Rickettsiales bacterium]